MPLASASRGSTLTGMTDLAETLLGGALDKQERASDLPIVAADLDGRVALWMSLWSLP